MPNFYKMDDFRHFDWISRPVQMPFTSIELFKLIKTDTKKLFNLFSDIFLIMQALLTKFFLLEKNKFYDTPQKIENAKSIGTYMDFLKSFFCAQFFSKPGKKFLKENLS